MVKAIRFHETGGPEVLKLEDIDLAAPASHEVRVRHTAIGVNYIDTYHRSGLYPLQLPSGLGMEAAGVVEEVGSDVTNLVVGDRIAHSGASMGSYSEASNLPAARLAKIPDGVSDETAAAMMLKGMTAGFLLHDTYPVKKGETIVFHAAAGGVGLIASQWAKALGATVIGTVGSQEKAELARANGCEHTVLYRTEDLAARVMDITGGAKVPVVYDSVGKDTFMSSLDCLHPRGLMVSFGNASGPVTGVDLGVLAAKGSLYVTRPTMVHYTMSPEDLERSTSRLFDAVATGTLKIRIGQTYSLADAAQAHRDLEARKTTGATILAP